MKFNKRLEIWKYALSAILISFILLIMYSFEMKTYKLVSVVVPLIFAYILNSTENDRVNANNNKLNYSVLLCILALSLSYGFDHILAMDLNIGNDNNVEVHSEAISLDENVENEEQDEIDTNYLHESYMSQDTTNSVRYITPSQLEHELKSEMSYIPNVSDKIMNRIMLLSATFNAEIPNIDEYYSKSAEIVNEKVQIALHIEDGYPVSELNGNLTVTQLLEQANEIDLLIKKNSTVENNIELMNNYQEAYKLAPCSKISLQLARPYEEIILIHPRRTYEECDKIIEYGAKGIEYFLQTLAYKTYSSSTDGDIVYRIAKIYHCLGDLPNLDVKYRTEMYQISSAYFELSISLKDEEDSYNAHKPYYAAMVNHKLGVISNEDNYFYLKRALDHYQNTLFYDSIKEQMKSDVYNYSAEICNRLINYINKYGQMDNLYTIEFYKELAMEYSDNINYQ